MRISDWSSDVCSSDLAADDEDVERLLRGDLLGRLRLGAGVELREDLFEFHPALADILAIQEDRRHRHDLTRIDLRLKQTAVARGVGDARVDEDGSGWGRDRVCHDGDIWVGSAVAKQKNT